MKSHSQSQEIIECYSPFAAFDPFDAYGVNIPVEETEEAADWNINAVGIKRIEGGERRVKVDRPLGFGCGS